VKRETISRRGRFTFHFSRFTSLHAARCTIRLLAERNQLSYLQQLTAIAERDPNPELRREATRRLGEKTKNP
jgi:hypothetical protein